MSKPRSTWWGYVKSMIAKYPQRKGKRLEGLEAREFEAVLKAIEQTKKEKCGEDILKIINLVFWKRSHTLAGASMQVHCSYETAKKYHRNFIREVAKAFRCDGLT